MHRIGQLITGAICLLVAMLFGVAVWWLQATGFDTSGSSMVVSLTTLCGVVLAVLWLLRSRLA